MVDGLSHYNLIIFSLTFYDILLQISINCNVYPIPGVALSWIEKLQPFSSQCLTIKKNVIIILFTLLINSQLFSDEIPILQVDNFNFNIPSLPANAWEFLLIFHIKQEPLLCIVFWAALVNPYYLETINGLSLCISYRKHQILLMLRLW